MFFFKTLPSGTDWLPSFAIFGDLGAEHSDSLPLLQEDTQRGLYDVIIHAGDIAYDLDKVGPYMGHSSKSGIF